MGKPPATLRHGYSTTESDERARPTTSASPSPSKSPVARSRLSEAPPSSAATVGSPSMSVTIRVGPSSSCRTRSGPPCPSYCAATHAHAGCLIIGPAVKPVPLPYAITCVSRPPALPSRSSIPSPSKSAEVPRSMPTDCAGPTASASTSGVTRTTSPPKPRRTAKPIAPPPSLTANASSGPRSSALGPTMLEAPRFDSRAEDSKPATNNSSPGLGRMSATPSAAAISDSNDTMVQRDRAGPGSQKGRSRGVVQVVKPPRSSHVPPSQRSEPTQASTHGRPSTQQRSSGSHSGAAHVPSTQTASPWHGGSQSPGADVVSVIAPVVESRAPTVGGPPPDDDSLDDASLPSVEPTAAPPGSRHPATTTIQSHPSP